jgi:hypothetical protein
VKDDSAAAYIQMLDDASWHSGQHDGCGERPADHSTRADNHMIA